MTILLVDIGNTRVKWALLRGKRLSPMKALAHEREAWGMHRVVRAVMRAVPGGVSRIISVSVAGPDLERSLRGAARARLRVETEFVRSTRAAAGVRNGYRETWRLGADRWVGVVGAYHLAKGRPVLVANVGTALTLDAVSAKGQHLGGAIAPGPMTMVQSLLKGTHGIRRRARGGSARTTRGMFTRDTASALEAGACHAAGALIDRAAAEARTAFGAAPLLILTGGAAAQLRPFIKSKVRVVPDLVLRGLAVLAES